MKKAWIRRSIAAVLFFAALLVTFATVGSDSISSAANHIKDFCLSPLLVQWELGDYFCLADGLELPIVLALQEIPFLLSARSEIVQHHVKNESESTQYVQPSSPATPDAPALQYGDNGVPAQTVIPKNAAGYTMVGNVYIKNASNKTLDAATLSGGFAAQLQQSSPQVLILHTHGSEAYTLSEGQSYLSTGNYRTSESQYSVIRVGDEIAATLSEYGISVLHDRALYDDPYYEGAYERAAASIEAYLEKYPSITYVLDIHRDAVEDGSGKQYKLVSQEEPNAAQLSFIMGSSHEGWEENLKLAVAVSAQISSEHPTIMRPITLRNSNYNEQYTPGSMLVEVGAAGNSPEEAIRAGQIFAQGFAKTIIKK